MRGTCGMRRDLIRAQILRPAEQQQQQDTAVICTTEGSSPAASCVDTVVGHASKVTPESIVMQLDPPASCRADRVRSKRQLLPRLTAWSSSVTWEDYYPSRATGLKTYGRCAVVKKRFQRPLKGWKSLYAYSFTMESPSRISTLWQAIARDTAILDEYFRLENLPTPTWDVDGPQELRIPSKGPVCEAYERAVDDTLELHKLLIGSSKNVRSFAVCAPPPIPRPARH